MVANRSVPRQPPVEPVRVVARTIRGSVRKGAASVALYTGLAWAWSFVPLSLATEAGRASVADAGLGWSLLSWLLLSCWIAVGHALGYFVLSRIVLGQRVFAERRVVRLVAGDALAAMAGGYLLGFLPLTLMRAPLMMLAWAAVIGFLFSFAALSPAYHRRFQRAVANGDTVRD